MESLSRGGARIPDPPQRRVGRPPGAESDAIEIDGDVLAVLQRQGYRVELARCDKVYQLSSGRWYRISAPGQQPTVLKREVRFDTVACPRGQESYTQSLDGALPPLAAGEVDAVRGACPGR